MKRIPKPKILVIFPENLHPIDVSLSRLAIEEINAICRPKDLSSTPSELLTKIEDWFQKVAEELRPQFSEEPQRLLQKHEYRSAIISVMTLLEITLTELLQKDSRAREKHYLPMYRMLSLAKESSLVDEKEFAMLIDFWTVRTRLVHTKALARASQAGKIVREVARIVSSLKHKSTHHLS